MLTARRFRLIALAALSAFVFAQAATAAMGCASLRADAVRGNVAVMPSGEPCEMMGALPAPITLKALTPDASATPSDAGHLLALPAPHLLTVLLPDPAQTGGPGRATLPARIHGPPPYLATLRLRV